MCVKKNKHLLNVLLQIYNLQFTLDVI